MNANAAEQAGPYRLKSMRLQRPVRMNPLQVIEDRQRVLKNFNTGRGGETALGAFCEAQEEAARRIAHRLHDESAQMLATIYLGLAEIARDCPDATAQKIERLVRHLDGVREQLRDLSHELCPPILDQLGLMPALQSLASGVSDRSGLKIEVSGNMTTSLPRLVSAVLYRVVQEALSNVVRHAEATEAVVRLSIEDQKVLCTVKDDGIGFKTSPQHQAAVIGTINGPVNGGLGLAGIHQRVTALKGSCRIASCRIGGMELKVEIPL
jgi:signal transduction histidine kinase